MFLMYTSYEIVFILSVSNRLLMLITIITYELLIINYIMCSNYYVYYSNNTCAGFNLRYRIKDKTFEDLET